MKTKRHRKSIMEEIAHTKRGDMHETVTMTISMTRGLYLHALGVLRCGDYSTLSGYMSDLVRRDKQARALPPVVK